MTFEMDRLILFRHGEAERPSAGGQDIDRALDALGRTETRAVAAELARQGLVPDLALVSAARRTRETWAEMAEIFANAAAEFDLGLYNADPETLLASARAATASTVIVIAHNPGLHMLAAYLGQSAAPDLRKRLERSFPTGGAAAFRFESGGKATCEAVVFPKDVR